MAALETVEFSRIEAVRMIEPPTWRDRLAFWRPALGCESIACHLEGESNFVHISGELLADLNPVVAVIDGDGWLYLGQYALERWTTFTDGSSLWKVMAEL